jgi:predicted heme/steroid binding protein
MSGNSSALDNNELPGSPGSSGADEPRRFSRAELAAYDGRDPTRPTLIAYKGKVYDVSRSYPWAGGVHWARLYAGEDLTGKIIAAPHGEEMLARVPCIGVLED